MFWINQQSDNFLIFNTLWIFVFIFPFVCTILSTCGIFGWSWTQLQSRVTLVAINWSTFVCLYKCIYRFPKITNFQTKLDWKWKFLLAYANYQKGYLSGAKSYLKTTTTSLRKYVEVTSFGITTVHNGRWGITTW